MKNLFKIIKFIINHPIGKTNKFKYLYNFFKWQIISKIYKYPIIVNYIQDSKLIVKKSLHSATANMYVGLQEFEEMAFTLHVLKEEDFFCDIGANIGIYSILASKIKKSKTIAFEPDKTAFYYLKNNISINNIEDKVLLNKFALGNFNGNINFSKNLNSENHIINSSDKNIRVVNIQTLNTCITNIPILIKIDVEGYEYHILQGASEILKNKTLKAIIIELNGIAKRYNIQDSSIHNLLLKNNFKLYNYNPFLKKISAKKEFSHGNNLYIRDIEFIKNRIQNCGEISVYNVKL